MLIHPSNSKNGSKKATIRLSVLLSRSYMSWTRMYLSSPSITHMSLCSPFFCLRAPIGLAWQTYPGLVENLLITIASSGSPFNPSV